MLRISDGKWTNENIMRVYPSNSTIHMENSSSTNGDIFLLAENGSQLLTEDTVNGTDDLKGLLDQVIKQEPVFDLSILSGGAYYNTGYKEIKQATALVSNVLQYKFDREVITELVLDPGSQTGEFIAGHTITGPDKLDSDLMLSAKISPIIDKADQHSTEYQSSQYFSELDKIIVESDVGHHGIATIDSLKPGTITEIIVDTKGSYYEIGDKVIVDNRGTNGTGLEAQVSIVNGGFIPEEGTLEGEYRISLEDDTPDGEDGELLTSESIITFETPTGVLFVGEIFTGITSNATGIVIEYQDKINTLIYVLLDGEFSLGETLLGSDSQHKITLVTNTVEVFIANEDETETQANDRIVLEGETVRQDSYLGSVLVQEEFTGDKDITDIIVTSKGYGYTYLPTLSIYSVVGLSGKILAKGNGVGTIDTINIINQGIHYSNPESVYFNTTTNFLCVEVSDPFTLEESVVGLTSGATAIFKEQNLETGIIKMYDLGIAPFVEGEIFQGQTSGETAKIDSYTRTNIPGLTGTSVYRTGKYLGEDGFISEASKRVQDSYYYQDFSYVVKTASSIVDWRNNLLSTVHPSGWALFGQIDVSSLLKVPSSITLLGELLGAAFVRVWISNIDGTIKSVRSKFEFYIDLLLSKIQGSVVGTTYGNLSDFMFINSMVNSEKYLIDFRGHNVYPVPVPYDTLNIAATDIDTTFTVADTSPYTSMGTIQIGEELIDYTGKSALNLTGCVRGQYGTTATNHDSGLSVGFVEWGVSQNDAFGYRFMDWERDYQGNLITFGDLENTPFKKNNITPPTEITLFKT